MSPPAAIELDLTADWQPPERPPPRPFIRRTFGVLLVLGVLLGGLTAGRPRTSLEPGFELSGEGAQDVRVDNRTIYVLRTTNVDTAVEAYRLTDGRRLWRFRRDGILSLIDRAGGRVLLSEPNAATDATDLIALDAADGRPVWTRASAAMPYYNTSGVADVVIVEPSTPAADAPSARARPLTALDPDTGAVLWTAASPPGSVRSYHYLGTDRRRLRMSVAELDPNGSFTLREGATGTVLRTARLPLTGQVAAFSMNADWLLAYASSGSGGRRSTAYDLRTGRPTWSAPDRTADGGSVSWCGTGLLCSSDGEQITAVDLATGRSLWRAADGDGITVGDDARLIASSSHITDAGQTVRDTAIIDATTGTVRVNLPDWQIVDTTGWPRLVAVRPTGPGVGVVARIDARTGAAEVFGRMPSMFGPANCAATADFLICDAEALIVWRIR